MEDKDGYAVYFFPPALEALGEAIKPFLLQGPTGEHVLCRRIDTAGSLIGMHLYGRNAAGVVVQVELMVPTNMVRMIVSARSDEAFGFGPRRALEVAGASSGSSAKPDQAPKPDPRSTTKASKAPPAKAKPAKSKPASPKPAKAVQQKRTGAAKKSKPKPRPGTKV